MSVDNHFRETSADIIAEMETERPGLMNAPINTNNLYYARRLKAALEREHAKAEAEADAGGCTKLPKLPKVDTRFDICQDIALVLKIGRDFQNKDGYRGAHYDTVKLLCDAVEYQQEQTAKLREALEALLNLAYEVEDMNSDSGPRAGMPTKFVIDTVKTALAATSSQTIQEDNK